MKFSPLLVLPAAVLFFCGGSSAAGAGEIEASIVKSRPAVENRRTPAIIRLDRRGGLPVMDGEFVYVDLHILDPGFEDYIYAMPRPMNAPGNFIFTLTPRTACGYRVWAEMQGEEGPPRFARADLPGAEDCGKKPPGAAPGMTDEGDRFRFALSVDTGALKAGQDSGVTVTVSDGKGASVRGLDPVAGAYAQLVGFYDDYETMAVFTPLDEDLTGSSVRFSVRPGRTGFLTLFARFRIDGQDVMARFGVDVAPEVVPEVAPGEPSAGIGEWTGGADAGDMEDLDSLLGEKLETIRDAGPEEPEGAEPEAAPY